MTALRVCVYAICKNEAKFVDRWMDSMSEADLVVVTDTGSDDGTPEALRARGAVVYTEIIRPWRFDEARNRSLERVPEEMDICVCTDLDEYFHPGWRKKLEEAWQNYQPRSAPPIAKTGRYLYNWSLKEDGSPDIQFYYFKIHDRHGFRWKCPVHEYLRYEGHLPVESVTIEGIELNHAPDPAKSRGSYLPLLEMAVEEAPDDDRMRYYLGREYMYKAQWQKCVDTLKAYLAMPSARWNEERAAAMRWIAASYEKLSKHREAYAWYFRAAAEAPHMRDGYVEFARMCYRLADWPVCLAMAEEALKIREKSKNFINMGYAWDASAEDYAAIAAYKMKLFERARMHAQNAVQIDPKDARLIKNLELIELALRDTGP